MSKFISVSQYAELYNKDPGNIRRYLSSGRMEGHKVGSQWVIAEDAKYPDDSRLKSGNYRNSRKRAELYSNNAELMYTVNTLSSELCEIYGDTLKSVILYGSYARGTQSADSDVDIAIILHGEPDRKSVELMIECVSKHELDCEKVLSVIDIQLDQFEKWRNILPFYKNIEKEGIVIWKAA